MVDWWLGLGLVGQLVFVGAIALGLGLLLGWALASIQARKPLGILQSQLAEARAHMQAEKRIAEERERAFKQAEEHLEGAFSLLSERALDRSGRAFLRMAEERLSRQSSEAGAELKARQQAIESMVKPIREALEKTQSQVREMEASRQSAFGSLEKHLELLATDQRNLQQETRNLVQALRRPEVRGRWGEMTLRRLVSLAGMVEHCDFAEQVSVQGETGTIRPDMIISLPDERDIVVDVKTPLDAYLTAQEAATDEEREKALASHARNVRIRVRELSDKAYWEQFKSSPDFVVLFIPGEQFVSAAMERDRTLFEDALKNKVIIASPTSIIAILRSVAFSWRQLDIIKNAEEIRDLAETFYKRVAVFTEHYGKLGRSLSATVDHFNKTVGSLNRQVLPGALKLSEMGVSSARDIVEPSEIEKKVRDVPDA